MAISGSLLFSSLSLGRKKEGGEDGKFNREGEVSEIEIEELGG